MSNKHESMPNPVLDVRHLRLLVTVVEEGSLTGAGKRLHLTQSALSHQLLDLERRLGGELFHRVGRVMRPTQACERILVCARRILDELRRGEEDARAILGGRSGRLRITTECYTLYHWLPRLLERFRRKHPGIEVEIDVDATRRPIESIIEGSIDLAIVSIARTEPRIQYEELFADELLVIVAPDHRLATRRFASARDLASENLLVYASLDQNDAYRLVLQPAGLSPASHAVVPLTEAAIELVRSNMGVAVMARWAIAPRVADGTVVAIPVGRRGLHRKWYGALLGGLRPTAAQSDFLAILASDGARATRDDRALRSTARKRSA